MVMSLWPKSAVTIFAPVVTSMASELGLTEDAAKIWFGILFVMNIQIYL